MVVCKMVWMNFGQMDVIVIWIKDDRGVDKSSDSGVVEK